MNDANQDQHLRPNGSRGTLASPRQLKSAPQQPGMKYTRRVQSKRKRRRKEARSKKRHLSPAARPRRFCNQHPNSPEGNTPGECRASAKDDEKKLGAKKDTFPHQPALAVFAISTPTVRPIIVAQAEKEATDSLRTDPGSAKPSIAFATR